MCGNKAALFGYAIDFLWFLLNVQNWNSGFKLCTKALKLTEVVATTIHNHLEQLYSNS